MNIIVLIKRRLQSIRSFEDVKTFVFEGLFFVARYLRYWRDLVFPLSVKHLGGPRKISLSPDAFIVLCLVRDGEEYVHSFVKHYTALGASHLVFLDNGSNDGTVDTLRNFSNVTILQSTLLYKKYKLTIRRYLVRRFAGKRWSLFADIDELFDFPFSDQVSLTQVLGYLRQHKFTAVMAHMLDMLPAPNTMPPQVEPFELLKICPYYETESLTWDDYEHHFGVRNHLPEIPLKSCHDGVRKRLFNASPLLSRHPLVLLDHGTSPYCYSAHNVCAAAVADFTAVLYHFKFLEGFEDKIRKAAEEENYHDGSRMYKSALKVLESGKSLEIPGPDARVLEDVGQLLEEGFLIASPRFRQWVADQSART